MWALAPMAAKPQVKLESRRHAVSIATLCRSNRSLPLGPPAVSFDQHRIGGEERREHHDVAEQEDPEAVADDDALRGGARVVENRRGRGRAAPLAPTVAVVRACLEGRHEQGLRGRERLAPRAPVGAVDARDLFGRNLVFGAVAPGEDDEGRESADEADDDEPPDVPDHAEPREGGEERADEAGRRCSAASRSACRPARRRTLPSLARALLHAPIVVDALDLRQHGEIEGRRRRGRRPFERAARPGIAGRVAQLFAIADADDELQRPGRRCRPG